MKMIETSLMKKLRADRLVWIGLMVGWSQIEMSDRERERKKRRTAVANGVCDPGWRPNWSGDYTSDHDLRSANRNTRKQVEPSKLGAANFTFFVVVVLVVFNLRSLLQTGCRRCNLCEMRVLG